MSMSKGEARTLIGKRVVVNTLSLRNVAGEVRRYFEGSGLLLVRVDQAVPDLLNRPTDYIHCKPGAVKRA